MSHIDLKLDGTILTPSDENYAAAIHRLTDLAIRKAAYVGLPTSYDDVLKLIAFARANALELAIKGGGNNINDTGSSSSEGGLVIDLAKLNKVQVREGGQEVVVQGGALWGDVYQEASKHRVDVVGGNVWSVGVGGFLTGGGHSNLSALRGLGSDNIVEVTVALADGGTSRFGAVLEFVLRAYPTQGAASVGVLVLPRTVFEQFVTALEECLAMVEPQDRIIIAFARAPPEFCPGLLVLPYIPGPPTRAEALLRPFRALNPVVDVIQSAPDQLAVSHGSDAFMANAPRRVYLAGSLLNGPSLGHTRKMFTDIWARWAQWTGEHEEAKESMVMWEYQPVGVVKDKGTGESAFSKRDTASYVVIHGRTRVPEFDKSNISWVRETIDLIRAQQPDGGAIPNFAYGDESGEVMFGAANAKRLKGIKAKYDPDNVWAKGARI
ncbi:hypothetical protein EW146_g8589 [Bondarzewia mesenterica]|uniref:FAD-binding PCMH-type domain-containing protein n=1 Tax=Bondarzewia mesenterica TaxID=1095465 RepID=A0A4S4LD75_9AGAM|nr:hypothetical protein EW146_g8589 [Bondarzewia mesenterica]